MALFADVGLVAVKCDYVLRELVNKKEGISVPRVFVQGCFRKPHPEDGATGSASCQSASATCEHSRTVDSEQDGDMSTTEPHRCDSDSGMTNRTDDDRNVNSDVTAGGHGDCGTAAGCHGDSSTAAGGHGDDVTLNRTDDDKLQETV